MLKTSADDLAARKAARRALFRAYFRARWGLPTFLVTAFLLGVLGPWGILWPWSKAPALVVCTLAGAGITVALTTAAWAGLVATSATRNPGEDRRLYFYNNERAIAAMVLARPKVDGSGATHWHGSDFGAWPRKKGAGMVLGQHVVGEVTTAGDELSFLATCHMASVYLEQMPGVLHRVRHFGVLVRLSTQPRRRRGQRMRR